MKRIVIFMDNPVIPTGYASTCRLTAQELGKRGWDVYATSFNGGTQSDTIQDWYNIKILPNYALQRNVNANYGDGATVVQIFNELAPDILFFHNDAYRYAYIENLPKNILERSVFWLPFEGEHPDVFGVRLFSKCSATRFVTKHALGIHQDSLKDKDIGYIPHAIDSDTYIPFPDKRAAKLEKSAGAKDRSIVLKGLEDKFVVLRVDRHTPRKYWDLSLKAFAKFAQNKQDVFFLAKCNPRDIVMWDDKEKKGVDLEALAKELNISDKIFFDDYFFSSPCMAHCFYHAADVFLTTTSGEGYGLGAVEAMACALPVIYPNVPVLPEVVGDAGIPCKLKGQEWYQPMQLFHNIVDVDDVAEKLEWSYNDWKNNNSQELKKIGERGRKRVEEKYTPKIVYDQWDKVFATISERRDLVSIVTVLYNVSGQDQIYGEDGIDKFKESLEKYVKHPYEWIIVDNGSPEREITRKWLSEVAVKNPRIKPIYLETNLGFAGGCNVGISKSKGVAVALCNPDCEALDHVKLNLPADFLKMYLDRSYSDPNIGIMGLALNKRDDVLTGSNFPYFCNVMITRACLDACKIGENKWLDENYFSAYYEDLDFVLRAMGKGFKIVEQNIPFWHKSGGTNKYTITNGQYAKQLEKEIEKLAIEKPNMADWNRKRGEVRTKGMQGMIDGNIAYLNSKYGPEARQKIKIVWETHIGAGVGFSQIAEGLIPELDKLGFDVYVNDWSGGANIEDPLIRKLVNKTRKANEDSDDLENSIHIICWLMESFLDVDAEYKVGWSFCESTKVRPQYLQACNSMDRILTCSEFCRTVQKNSGYTSPIHVLSPGIHPIYMNYYERPVRDKFTFLAVGVSQERKDTYRLVQSFCQTFPKDADYPPQCEPGFPLKPSQIELILKSNVFGELSWVQRDGFDKIANIRTIYTGNDPRADRKDYTMQEMYDLYTSADCLVNPSHGEGANLPNLEAAATGLPVIFTNWSSPAEYFNETNSYPCSLGPNGTDMGTAYPSAGPAGENGLWSNCHQGHLQFLMRQVIRDRNDAKAKGKKAAEDMKKNHNWKDTAAQMMPLIFEWEEERKKKDGVVNFDPLTFNPPKLEPIKKGDRIVCDIASRDRHNYLCTLLVSLLNQTFKEWDIVIQCDDSDETMTQDHQFLGLMNRCMHEGHNWRVIRSHQQGPHIAHERSLQMAVNDPVNKYKLVCRIDDDIYLDSKYLEKLYDVFLKDTKGEVGAVSGVYPDPKRSDAEQMAPSGFETDINYAGKIDHNVLWPYICKYPPGTPPRQMEHLYSSFLYRTEAAIAIGGYYKKFSQIGHREESDFSYRFHLGGWKLFVQPEAIGYHFCAPSGGIRSKAIVDKQHLAESDHKMYMRRLDRWKKRVAMRQRGETDVKKPVPVIPQVTPQAIPQDIPQAIPQVTPITPQVKKPHGSIATVINCGSDIPKIKEAIKRFAPWSNEIYITTPEKKDQQELRGFHDKLKMIAVAVDEIALLTKSLLSDDTHEFIMTVSDSMHLEYDPGQLINDSYDDYVCEVFKTYMPGRMANNTFVQDDSMGIVMGPECQNICVLSRKRANAQTKIEKVLYSDMLVYEDEKLAPVNGKSVMGNELIQLNAIGKINWKKICLYQYPEGKLKEPRYSDILAYDKLVSIIIPTPGRKQLLKQCIDSIYSHTTTPFEIIIIDNDSQDDTATYLEAEAKLRPNLKHYRQPINYGYQKAINIGISKAKGDYLLLFNDDAWVIGREPDGRDWLQVYIDELKNDPKLGIIGPHGCISPALKQEILFFWCVMFHKSLYREIGPLDDVTFKNYGGDDDYVYRTKKAGYSIKARPTNLRHLMTCVPENIKKPELNESVVKLKAKYPEVK